MKIKTPDGKFEDARIDGDFIIVKNGRIHIGVLSVTDFYQIYHFI